MAPSFRISSLIPPGFAVESVERTERAIHVVAHAESDDADCPLCGEVSGRVHSHYIRLVRDLPCAGCAVDLAIVTRRFFCTAPACPRRIFAERFGDGAVRERARRTERLDCIVHHLGLALGGRPGASFARRLMLPVSNDTLLRLVRRRAFHENSAPTVIGIDDWAWKRGQRYGTVICDLEQRKIIDLLPDREPATLDAWLGAHPSIRVISRDRGGGYGQAAARARPDALQVADRWHLMENASAAFLAAVRRSMPEIRRRTQGQPIDRALLTQAERIQHDGFLLRQKANAQINALAKDGLGIKAIVKKTGYSRKTIRAVLRGERTDVFRSRTSSLEAWLIHLDGEWTGACHNGTELWRRMQGLGFTGSLRVVGEWATRRRHSEQAKHQLSRTPSARRLARVMTVERTNLSKDDAVLVSAVEAAIPSLVKTRGLMEYFQTMIRTKDDSELPAWIGEAMASPIASFAVGIRADQAAVAAAMTQPWSNGQTEGQITKLKLVKRQMYGRAKLDLLKARLIGAP